MWQQGRARTVGLRDRTFESFGIIEFRRAIAQDSSYAPAWAGLADCYVLLVEWGVRPLQQTVAMAEAAALRALELDSTLGEAYTSLGEIRVAQRDWRGAEASFRRAIALNPGYATAFQWYAWFLSHVGRHDEAVAAGRRARHLDPLSLIVISELGAVHLNAHEYDSAISVLQSSLQLDDSFEVSWWRLGYAYGMKGMYDEAIAAFERPSLFRGALHQAWAYGEAGRPSEALRMLRQAIAQEGWDDGSVVSPVVAAWLATAYTGLGDFDRALSWLERAYDLGLAGGPISLKTWPPFDPLRSQPRFQKLILRMAYPN